MLLRSLARSALCCAPVRQQARCLRVASTTLAKKINTSAVQLNLQLPGIRRSLFSTSRFLEVNCATELAQEGQFKEAQSLLEHSLLESIKENGPLHIKTITVERHVATILMEQGFLVKAEEICTNALKAIKAQPAAGGGGDGEATRVEVLGFQSILANILLEKRQFAEAQESFRSILAEQVQVLGGGDAASYAVKSSDDILTTQSNLGRALIGMGSFDESEAILRANLANYLSKFNNLTELPPLPSPSAAAAASSPDPDPQKVTYSVGTLKCMDALATCLMLQFGRQEDAEGSGSSIAERNKAEAEGLFRRIHLAHSAQKGENHRLTLRAAANLGTFLESLGESRLDEAEELLSSTLEAQKNAPGLGPRHPDTLITMSYLGELYDNYNFTEEAMRLWKESMEAHIAAYGHDHVDTLRSKMHVAGMLVNSDENDDACKLLQEVLRSRVDLLGEHHYDTMSVLKSLAETYYGMGRHEESEQYFLRCLDCLRVLYPDVRNGEQYETLLVKGSLGLLYLTMGTRDPETLQIESSRPGDVHVHRTAAELLQSSYDHFKEARDGFERLHGKHDIHYFRALGNLATYYISTSASPVLTGAKANGDLDDAHPASPANRAANLLAADEMLHTVIDGMTELLGPEHDYTIGYISNLAMLLFNEQRNFKEASELYQKVYNSFEKKYTNKSVKTLTVLYPLTICLAYSGQIDDAIHSAIVYCQHSKELFGEDSAEVQAGVDIIEQLRNYKITPSKDHSEGLRSIYETNDVDEDISRRSDPNDVSEGEDDGDFDEDEIVIDDKPRK